MKGRFIVLEKRRGVLLFVFFLFILAILPLNYYEANRACMVMGGNLHDQLKEGNAQKMQSNKIEADVRENEKYFRPSKLPILNDRYFETSFMDDFYGKETSEIKLPEELFKTQEDAILNYFSILREAANPEEGKLAGCGTIGNAMLPYPIAYQFLSADAQKNLSYKKYVETFQNILHINLIKMKEVPTYEPSKYIRYFIELETIEGSEKEASYFAYYYGFLDLIKEGEAYKIANFDLFGENYLCAPYHGWAYDAETVVDIKYGDWCGLVADRLSTQQDGYVKKIYFNGTDGKEYFVEFYELTNGTDIEIAQYMKKDGEWSLIQLDPESCIRDSVVESLR